MTRAQRKKISIGMKAVYAKKKKVDTLRDKAVNSLEQAANYLEQAAPQEAAVDLNHLREFNYRRGLVTAMECILRELH